METNSDYKRKWFRNKMEKGRNETVLFVLINYNLLMWSIYLFIMLFVFYILDLDNYHTVQYWNHCSSILFNFIYLHSSSFSVILTLILEVNLILTFLPILSLLLLIRTISVFSVVSNLHYSSLWPFSISVFSFLRIPGDFVDRGPRGVEVMCLLLALFSAFPRGTYTS